MDEPLPAASTSRPGLILALICLPVFIGALDLTIVSAVLPNVITDLRIPIQTGGDDAAWVVSGYLLAYTISVALMGRVSDLIGRRRTYFIALLIFILGSWLVAIATLAPAAWMRRLFVLVQEGRPDSAYMALYALIAGRVVQALGAGAMVPVSMALVGDLYPPGQRATPLGIVGAVDTAGWVLGHLYGGLMVQFVTWPILFWINIPITTAVAALTWRRLEHIASSHQEGNLTRSSLAAILVGVGIINLLALLAIVGAITPELIETMSSRLLGSRWLSLVTLVVMLAAVILSIRDAKRPAAAGRPDWAGAGLITLTLVGLSLGLGGESGQLPPQAVFLLIGGLIALGAFVFVERRVAFPLFDLAHFRNRNVSLASVINLLVGFCLMVGLVSVPLFVNAVIATSADEGALLSGILLAGLTVPMALASAPGGMLTARFGYRIPTVIGLVVAAVGFFLATTWTPDVPRVLIALHLALAGIGLGLTVAPIGTTVINAVRSSERGIASALVLIMRLIGMTLGTAIMTGYGLRRSTALMEQAAPRLSESFDPAQLLEVLHQTTTQTITEMLLIAAVVCAAAIIPAVLLCPRDTAAEPQ